MLPNIEQTVLPELNFPTLWQAVIYRNYGYVKTRQLAKVLGTTSQVIKTEAKRLGLTHSYNPEWLKRGYVTIIRNNWYLLPYNQIIELLEITEQELDYVLKEEDFLAIKLGNVKPYASEVKYFPPSCEQIAKTEEICNLTLSIVGGREAKPFDFFSRAPKFAEYKAKSGNRILHGFLTPCGDVFNVDCKDYLTDDLLRAYSASGVTGLWMHGVLTTLSPYKFKPSLSKGYKKRRKQLNNVIKRCAKYGIKTYLYLNEPRCLPTCDFNDFAHLKGHELGGFSSLCLSEQEVSDYLYDAVKDLLTECSELGGIMTITMSENHTHCHFNGETNCAKCKDLPIYHNAVKVNNIISNAVSDSGSSCEVIANVWAWYGERGFTTDDTINAIRALDKRISVMVVSECLLDLEIAGVKNTLKDYSMSNLGPSEYAKTVIKTAQESGRKTYSKIQVNNSWELSCVPYIPVFDLVYEHIDNLGKIGCYDYFASWTLGGYPSVTLSLLAEYADKKNEFSLSEWYDQKFGIDAPAVKQAVSAFSKGFIEFPFSLNELYFAPHTLGACNLWSLSADQKSSCMVAYSWDDYQTWITNYPFKTYCNQFQKLLKEWGKGLELLDGTHGELANEVKTLATVSYLHFEYELLHTLYAYYKQDVKKYKAELLDVFDKVIANALKTIEFVFADARIGFEASNHYYYNVHNLIEKVINTKKLKSELELL